MTMNTKMASAIQILCFIAYVDEQSTHSEAIAKSLKTNPVVVRKLLKLMEQQGLVYLRQGRNGGVELAHDVENITLAQVYQALETEQGLFSLREQNNERCPVARSMKGSLDPIFDAANSAVIASLGQTTLADLLNKVR
ncbi:Rrf2 family transcriptional regulator [Serratia sp. M24T3]|uniref:Rrf2 family transcriptional regulator n=1 Tax=Serratia sp. M24T3 TaxID=932213 RepID=UPI00055C72E3|nr:Rrf2 family transcriptional regulator [Serratia sp. M24T3]